MSVVAPPILVEVLEEKGLRTGPAPLTEYQEQVKAEFTKTRAYTEFFSHPWHHRTLEPKVKEFTSPAPILAELRAEMGAEPIGEAT